MKKERERDRIMAWIEVLTTLVIIMVVLRLGWVLSIRLGEILFNATENCKEVTNE